MTDPVTTGPTTSLLHTPALAQALRTHARGLHPDEAAIEFLISHNVFLRRSDFTARFIEPSRHPTDGTPMAAIDWPAAITALDYGHLPCSSGEEQILRLAASLAEGLPVSLRDALTSIDRRGINLLIKAVLHTTGQRPPPQTP